MDMTKYQSLLWFAEKINNIFPLELESQFCKRDEALIVWVRPQIRHSNNRDVQLRVFHACRNLQRWVERYNHFELEELDEYMVKIYEKNSTSCNGDLEDFIGNHYLTATPYSD
jgi:hypothetical protein